MPAYCVMKTVMYIIDKVNSVEIDVLARVVYQLFVQMLYRIWCNISSLAFNSYSGRLYIDERRRKLQAYPSTVRYTVSQQKNNGNGNKNTWRLINELTSRKTLGSPKLVVLYKFKHQNTEFWIPKVKLV